MVSKSQKQKQAMPGEPLSLRVRTAQTGARRHALGLIFNRDWRQVNVTRNGSAHRELLANAGLVVEEVAAGSATGAPKADETKAEEPKAADAKANRDESAN